MDDILTHFVKNGTAEQIAWLRQQINYHMNQVVKWTEAVGVEQATEIMLQRIDEHAKGILEKEQKPTCKGAGCSFCCYIRVVISNGEAQVLQKHLTPADIEHLQKQSPHDEGVPQFIAGLAYKDRRCVFLKNNQCSVYEHRPSACRKYYVVNSVEDCDTEKNPDSIQQISYSLTAEIIHAALMIVQGHGGMSKTLLKIFNHDNRTDSENRKAIELPSGQAG